MTITVTMATDVLILEVTSIAGTGRVSVHLTGGRDMTKSPCTGRTFILHVECCMNPEMEWGRKLNGADAAFNLWGSRQADRRNHTAAVVRLSGPSHPFSRSSFTPSVSGEDGGMKFH